MGLEQKDRKFTEAIPDSCGEVFGIGFRNLEAPRHVGLD
jgi:hypothetical protein